MSEDGSRQRPRKDYTGSRFGCLTVIRDVGSTAAPGTSKHGAQRLWLLQCDCGRTTVLPVGDFARSGYRARRFCSRDCRLLRELLSQQHSQHGMSQHPAYAVWRSLRGRCRLPTHQAWKNYGARGITVCARWDSSFENFWADMGPTYQPGLTIEQRNNDAGYSPENCYWTTPKIQANNRRTNRRIQTPMGEMNVSEAAECSGLGVTTLLYRLDHYWPLAELFRRADFTNRSSTF